MLWVLYVVRPHFRSNRGLLRRRSSHLEATLVCTMAQAAPSKKNAFTAVGGSVPVALCLLHSARAKLVCPRFATEP